MSRRSLRWLIVVFSILSIISACKANRTAVNTRSGAADGSSNGNPKKSTFPNHILKPDGTRLDGPEIVFTANGQSDSIDVDQNSDVVIAWESPESDSCTVFPTGWTGRSGQNTVKAVHTSNYLILCMKGEQQFSKELEVAVILPPMPQLSIKANGVIGSTTVTKNSAVEITWEADSVTSCKLMPDNVQGTSGTFSWTATQTKVFFLECESAHGIAKSFVIINVNTDVSTQVSADIKVNGADTPVAIAHNSTATVSWTSTGASSCQVSPFSSSALSGNVVTPKLTATTVYLLNCVSASNERVMDAAIVLVAPPLPPTITFTANGVEPPVTLTAETDIDLVWISGNSTKCDLNSAKSGKLKSGISGSHSISAPIFSDIFYVVCDGDGGRSVAFAAVNVPINLPKLTMKANGHSGAIVISSGEPINLEWEAKYVTSCKIEEINKSGLTGSYHFASVTESKTLNLECESPLGKVALEYKIFVNGRAEVGATLSANWKLKELTVEYGASVTLDWTSANAVSCDVSPLGLTGKSGSHTYVATTNKTFTLECDGNNTTPAKSTVIVTVNDPPKPWIEFLANGSDGSPTATVQIISGTDLTLTWNVRYADQCFLGTDNASIPTGQSIKPNVTSARSYKLRCVGPGGENSKTINIEVKPQGTPASMVGFNFEDLPASMGGQDYNDAVACLRGNFVVLGQQVTSDAVQNAEITISRRAACHHEINIFIYHPNGSQQKIGPKISSAQERIANISMQKGSRMEVIFKTYAKSACPGPTGPFSSITHPERVEVLPNVCKTTGG